MGSAFLPASIAVLNWSLVSRAVASGSGVLTPTQMKAVSIIADIIIPETDTPGAATAGVPQFIDHSLADLMAKENAGRFIEGLDMFLAAEPRFLEETAAAQYQAVARLDASLRTDARFNGFYRQLKELVLIGYYTSEVGASVELAYDPLPGRYEPNILKPTDRSWSK